jgi:hypothetical protein
MGDDAAAAGGGAVDGVAAGAGNPVGLPPVGDVGPADTDS